MLIWNEENMYDLYLSHLDDIELEKQNGVYYFIDAYGVLREEGFYSNQE